jgi:hypothetical protein
MQRHQSLAARVEQAFERHRELRAEFDRLRAHFRAEREVAKRIFTQIDASKEALRLRPWARVDANWQAIELSEKYGSLGERAAILLLAEAFFRANENLRAIARRDSFPRSSRERNGHKGGTHPDGSTNTSLWDRALGKKT